MAGAASYIYSSPVASAMLPLHATTIIGCIVALLIHFRYQSVSRLTPFSQSAIIAYHGSVLAWVDATEQDRILLFWLTNMLLYFALRTHVANPAVLLAPILAGISSAFFSAWGGAESIPAVFLSVPAIAILAGLGDYVTARQRAITAAIDEWGVRRHLTPLSVLRQALRAEAGSDAMFEPATRTCVCISSDWRNYQRLSADLTPAQLENVLATYYQHVQTLLHESFPNGNYFADWIADELFVVVFGDGEAELPALVVSALTFCDALLSKKDGLFNLVERPPGVDVALAAG
jgi:hypothetical protein